MLRLNSIDKPMLKHDLSASTLRVSNKLVLLSIFSVIAGCNSSSDNAPIDDRPVQQGQFLDSAVSGLHYTSPSESGITDENGYFNYREGDTITFSVGGILLGYATGQAQITPFTLTGHKALENESEIFQSLRSTDVNAYDRALNIATFLQTLDQDSNPDNGIDLNAAHTLLSRSNIDLSFAIKASEFQNSEAYQTLLSTLEKTSGPTLVESFQHIYDSLSIDIKSSLSDKRFDLEQSEGVAQQEYQYNAEGQLVTLTENNDDTSISKSISFTYDANGQLQSLFDSISEERSDFVYTSDQQIASLTRSQNAVDVLSQSYGYDESGRITSFSNDLAADGVQDFSSSYDYDENGALSTIMLDLDGDTVDDQTTTLRYANIPNQSNASALKIEEYLEDSDGDEEANLSISYRYDASGNRITQNIRTEQAGSSFSTGRFSYDTNNNPTRYERDDNQDGVPEFIEAYRYNNNSQRTEYKRDNNADGRWDFIAQYFYDVNGNRIRMIEDSDGNGIADKTWEASYEASISNSGWDRIINTL